MMRRMTIPAIACLALIACDTEEETPVQAADDGRVAEGEVLEGAISDAMLPLDTIQSQSPPLETRDTPGSGDGPSRSSPAPAAEGNSADTDASDTPAPEPADETAPPPDDQSTADQPAQ